MMHRRFSVIAGLFMLQVLRASAQETTNACIQWNTSWPDTALPDAGLDDVDTALHYTVFQGSENLGRYNQSPDLTYHDDTLLVTWTSHDRYAQAPGTRALYSFSTNLQFWAEASALFDSIGLTGEPGDSGTELNPEWNAVNGHLYGTALVKDITGWSTNDTELTPIYQNAGTIARRIGEDHLPESTVYWLSETVPSGHEADGFVLYHQASDTETSNDLSQLKQTLEEEQTNYALPSVNDPNVSLSSPAYFTRPDGQQVGIYTDLSNGLRLYAAIRESVSNNWSVAEQTNIPDSASKTTAGTLSDGRTFIIGNFQDELNLRDPLIIAFSEDGISFDEAYALRCGAPQCRYKNPNDQKIAGYQVPDATVIGDILWVAYSISGEQIAVSRFPSTSNLIDNGGFESGESFPSDGWNTRLTENAVATYVSGTAGQDVHSGSRAVTISNPEGDVERWYLLNARSPSIHAGTSYEFSAWVKTENMDLASTYIEIDWLDAADSRIDFITSSSVTQDQDWSRLTVSGEAPAGAVKLRPMLMVDGTTGSDAVVTFDDCLIVPE